MGVVGFAERAYNGIKSVTAMLDTLKKAGLGKLKGKRKTVKPYAYLS